MKLLLFCSNMWGVIAICASDKNPNLEIWNAIADSHTSTIPLDFASHLSSLFQDAHILEVGCGYGRVLDYLQTLGFHNLFGVDGSSVMVNRAIAVGFGNCLVAVAEKLPFESGSFDCVLMIGLLDSISDKQVRSTAVTEAARVLRTGGLFLFRDFAVTLFGSNLLRYLRCAFRLKTFGNFIGSVGIEFHHFTKSEVRSLIANSGLTLRKLDVDSFPTMHGRTSRGITALATKP